MNFGGISILLRHFCFNNIFKLLKDLEESFFQGIKSVGKCMRDNICYGLIELVKLIALFSHTRSHGLKVRRVRFYVTTTI